MDLIEAVREAGVVTRILRAERQDDAVFYALNEKAVNIATEFDVSFQNTTYYYHRDTIRM
ncbi:hypothetical protein DPMN_085524 [Dreissena polymorpha]|uniref:Uncharacterized protein n=1 Tax=Dreissena polymorpha TaxID=45954 RepID=A0A9D3YG90_DREPO|nr:hypothetical protein DPMN_085524 [Dreissena polymorpha]